MSEPPPDFAAIYAMVAEAARNMVPHNLALGLTLDEIGDGLARMTLPYKPELVGDPDTGVLHGGAVTSLIDACSGLSVFMKLRTTTPIATLDLRIDYLRPAAPGRAVVARAECYRATRNVAFVRAVAYQDDPAQPVATSASTFMIGTKGRSVVGGALASAATAKRGP